MSIETIKKIDQKVIHLEDQRRQGWEAQWKDISDYIISYRGYFFDRDLPNQGDVRNSKIIDSTATRSIRILAAGLQSGLTSPSRPWIRLTLKDKEAAKDPLIKRWLSEVTETLRLALAMSNFYPVSHSAYLDLAGIGTAAIYLESGVETSLRFKLYSPGEYAITTNAQGRVDVIARRFNMTAKQMVERFGEDKVSADVKRTFKDNPYQYFEIVHFIEPRKNRNTSKVDNKNKPFKSVYYEGTGEKKALSESGYDEFPCMVPRWDTNGADVYGRSVGMDVLPDVKGLQEERKGIIMAVHKLLNPPMNVPVSMFGKANLLPGGENPYTNANEVVTPTMEIKYDINAGLALIQDTRLAIKEGFFNDLFLMISSSGGNMTATEVLEKQEEKLLMLGPVIERQQGEFHDPLVTRSLNILGRLGLLPQLPPELAEVAQDYEIEYISLLAQAQKMVGTKSINQLTSFVGSLVEIFPNAKDKYNSDNAIDRYAEMVGVPADIINSDDEVQVIREAEAQAEAEQAELLRMQTLQAAQGESVRQGTEAAKGASDIASVVQTGAETAQTVDSGGGGEVV